jgi:hypothetical protein
MLHCVAPLHWFRLAKFTRRSFRDPETSGHNSAWTQLTPSFFCRLDDDVVYWNTNRFSG